MNFEPLEKSKNTDWKEIDTNKNLGMFFSHLREKSGSNKTVDYIMLKVGKEF